MHRGDMKLLVMSALNEAIRKMEPGGTVCEQGDDIALILGDGTVMLVSVKPGRFVVADEDPRP